MDPNADAFLSVAVADIVMNNTVRSNPPFLALLQRIRRLQQALSSTAVGGLSDKQIKALPQFSYGHRDPSAVKDNAHCAICLSEFQREEVVRALPCLHIYHISCIDAWLQSSATCPVCQLCVAGYLEEE